MRKEEIKAVGEFKKNASEEDFLKKLNKILHPHDQKEYQEISDSPPCIFIVGKPRSGTTLLSQLLSFHTEVGYINNLIASFWDAPLYGIKLSEKLLRQPAQTKFESHYGRTQGLHEPHEFGYFWAKLLDYPDLRERGLEHEEKIDWNQFKKTLQNMSAAFGKPLVFKVFILSWHLKKTIESLPNSLVLHIERDSLECGLSLLKMRRDVLGDENEWSSVKPKEYEELRTLSPPEQVAGQLYYFEEAMKNQLNQIPETNKYEVSYEELCSQPAKVLGVIQDKVLKLGGELKLKSNLPSSFCRQQTEAQSPEELNSMLEALSKFYPQAEVAQWQ